MINLEEHRKTVVHCPTEELIKAVEDVIVNLGGRRLWDYNAKRYIIELKKQPTGMCFGLDCVERGGNSYCDLEYYKARGYLIMPAWQFLQLCGVDQVINNYQIF